MSAPEATAPTQQAPTRPGGVLAGMLSPLRYRDYRLLFLGQLISAIGDAFYVVALPWYMLTQGGGPANLGLILTAYGIPMGAATLLGGWLSDRLRPRRVMLFSDFARIFVVAAIAWVTFGLHAPLWHIAALTATLGLFDGMFMPASQAIAPDLLPDDQLQSANGLYFALMRLAQMVGPIMAGYIVAQANASLAFAVDAATFIFSTLTLLFIRGNRAAAIIQSANAEASADEPASESAPGAAEPPASESAPVTDSLWRFMLTTPYFLILFLVLVIANLLNGAVGEVALPSLAHSVLHSGSQGFGLMVGALGGGALVGGLLASALGNRVTHGVYSLGFFAAQSIVIVALAFSVNTNMAIALMASFGILNGLGNVTFMTLLQRKLPRNLLGRIMGVIIFANFATLPISVAAGGFAVDRYGPGPVIVVGGAILAVAMLIAFLNRDLRNL